MREENRPYWDCVCTIDTCIKSHLCITYNTINIITLKNYIYNAHKKKKIIPVITVLILCRCCCSYFIIINIVLIISNHSTQGRVYGVGAGVALPPSPSKNVKKTSGEAILST